MDFLTFNQSNVESNIVMSVVDAYLRDKSPVEDELIDDEGVETISEYVLDVII